jgi:AcrR family transcriptional regulator
MLFFEKTGALTPQKQEIISAAKDLFAQYGYDGLSIRDLATHCGLATATIYHHFRDKEDIFAHVLCHDFSIVHKRGMEIALGDGDALFKLRSVIQLHANLLAENRLLVMSVMRRIKTMEGDLPNFVKETLPRLLEPLATIIEQGVREGVIRPVDPKVAAVCALGMLNSLFTFSLIFEQTGMSDTITQSVHDIFLHGITHKDS